VDDQHHRPFGGLRHFDYLRAHGLQGEAELVQRKDILSMKDDELSAMNFRMEATKGGGGAGAANCLNAISGRPRPAVAARRGNRQQ
jgi:hypothetical protein